MDISADGEQLLLNTFGGLKLYDLDSRSTSRIVMRFDPYEEIWAQWSVDGWTILKGTNVVQIPYYDFYSVYRLWSNEWEYLDAGDTCFLRRL